MKALVGTFNQEKALVGAFFVITNLCVEWTFVSSSILVTVHIEPPVAHQVGLAEHGAVGAEEGVDGGGAATCHVPPAHVEHLAPRHGRRVRVVTCSNNAVITTLHCA